MENRLLFEVFYFRLSAPLVNGRREARKCYKNGNSVLVAMGVHH